MNRRRFLSLAGAAALAGCTSGDAPATATGTPTATPDPPNYELVSFDVPGKAELGETFAPAFEVRNTGAIAGEFETSCSVQRNDGTFQAVADRGSDIEPGSTARMEFPEITPQFLQEVTIRLDAFSETRSFRVTPAYLPFGRYFHLWNDTRVTVSEVQLHDTIEREGFDATTDEGEQFARVFVDAVNDSSGIETLPNPAQFDLLDGDTQYDAVDAGAGDAYVGGEVQPGVVRSGWVTFVVADDVEKSALQATWSQTTPDGDIAVYWPESQG